MAENISYKEAQRILSDSVNPMGAERVSIDDADKRIAAEDIFALYDLPAFDRSPYDGYAFIAEDSQALSCITEKEIGSEEMRKADGSVTLRVVEDIPAGSVPTVKLSHHMAARVMTGAPIPENADAVCKFEDTEYTEDTVTLKRSYRSGENIVHKGEDITEGTVICAKGDVIDSGVVGLMASQNISAASVYKIPCIGIISTGSELVEINANRNPINEAKQGRIFNSNRYILEASVKDIGCKSEYIGSAADNIDDIAKLIQDGLRRCDALILTGGVSVGDYDYTDDAMREAGVTILFQGVDIKPGMACAYGVYEGKPVCALSGNPASSLTNFALIAYPAIRKMCGYRAYMPPTISVTLADDVVKESPKTRVLRGRLSLESGCVMMNIPNKQGNAVVSSSIGCNAYAIVPKGSGPVKRGTVLEGFEFPVR